MRRVAAGRLDVSEDPTWTPEETWQALDAARARLEEERRAKFAAFGVAADCAWPCSRLFHEHSSLGPAWRPALTVPEVEALTRDGAYRRYPDHERTRLPGSRPLTARLDETILSRRSRSDFSHQPIALETLATLLHLSAGVTSVDDLPRRAAPSGGALYPVETYVMALAVDGLAPGTYHYVPVEHTVEHLATPSSVDVGIGATSAIFGVVHTVVLRPLPFADPDRVVVVGEEWHGQPGSVSVGNFVDWRTHATSFAALAAKEQFSFNLSDEGTPERVIGGRVTHTWFEVAGIGPLHGRVFTREEDAPGRDRVVVLSHRLWTRRFGGDPLVVGRGIALNGVNHSVIGVMRPEFDLTAASEELWTPVAFTPAQTADHDNHYLTAMARLAPGRSIDEARAELKTVYASMRAEYPGDHQVTQGVVEPFHRQFVGEYRQRLFVLLGAVALVLLIACVNVATLLLARGSARGREIALRAAIGAGRGRIARLLFTETLVLTLAGAAAGVAVAWLGVPVLVAYGPEGVPRLEQARVDGVVLGFALLIAILSALVAGLAPVIRAVMTDLRAVLNEGGRTGSPGRDRLGALLVAAEVGLAIVLLVGAGLLVRSALHLQRVDPGFDPRGVVTARLTLPAATYGDHTRVAESFEQIVSTLADMPGVRSAAASTMVPLTPGGNGNGLLPADKPIDPNYTVHAQLGVVTLDHFRTLRTPLRRGRSFTIDDRRGAPRVMIVNESAARGLFPGEDPIGKRVGCCEDPSDDSRMKTIIGVVADVRSLGPAAAPRPEFFLPIAQAPTGAWTWVQRTMTLVARADRGDVAQAMSAIREAVRRLDPTLPLYQVRTMEARLQASAGQSTFNTGLMLLLGAVGLCLSVLGTYGVISSFVTHRQREIGIRMALGAGSTDVMWLVVRQGMRPVLAGVLLGLAAAFASSRVLSAYVHGVTTTDPLTFGAVVAVLTAAALVAVTVPARRALRIDPGRVLSST